LLPVVRSGWPTPIRPIGARRGYSGDHPDYGGEVDHAELTGRLAAYDGGRCSHARRRCPRCSRCALPVSGLRPGTGRASHPQPVAAAHMGTSHLSQRPSVHYQRATPGRFAGVRGRAAGHAARPGDRRQARRSVPMDLHPARRRARRHPGRPVPRLGRRQPGLGRLHQPAAAVHADGLRGRARPRPTCSSPAASDTSYPSYEASHERLCRTAREFAR
jgi:hypothetical protein